MFRSEVGPMLINYENLHIENFKNYKNKLSHDLLVSVRESKASEVKALLAKGAAANFFDDKGYTLLAIAAENNDIATATVLLKFHPALIHCKNKNGLLPLAIAEREGNAKFAEFLLESSINNTLLTAVMVGDTAQVKALIAQNISTNVMDINGRHVLAIAADKGHDEIVKLLLQYNPKLLTVSSADRITPLFLAASKGYTKIVALLAEQKYVDVNECVNGFAPIYIAASKGYSAIVNCLLAQGADANQTYQNRQTILSAAINSGSIKTVESLLIHKVDVNKRDGDGMAPFAIAVHYQNLEMCKLLLQYNAKVTVNENDLLFKSISNIPLLTLLLEHKIDINHSAKKSYDTRFFNEIKKGSTPLLTAIHLKEKSSTNHSAQLDTAIRCILDHKPNVTLPDEAGYHALHHAVSLRDISLARALLENKANVNSYTDKCLSPLTIAANNNHREMIQLLINHKADIELANSTGIVPLMYAVSNCSDEAVITLLENKADINKSDTHGLTAIFYAITKHYRNFQEINSHNLTSSESMKRAFFVKDNAFTDEQKKGLTAALKPGLDKLFNTLENSQKLLYSKKIHNSEKIIKYLIDQKASVNIHSQPGTTPLILAVDYQLNDVLKVLLENSIDFDVNARAKDKNGYTPLHEAAMLGNETACHLLLEHKANIDTLDHNDVSALYYAVVNARDKIVKTLLAHNASLKIQECNMIAVAEYLGNKNILNLLKLAESKQSTRYAF